MRMRLGQDFRRRARFHELGQHLAVEISRVLDPAVELAVGERPGAAFTELDVGFGVEHAAPPQVPRVLGPLAHDLAAIEDDRPESHLRQDQPGEQSARSRADDHRPLCPLGCLRDEFIAGVRGLLDVAVLAKAREDRALILHVHVDRIDQLDVGLVARIVRAPGDDVANQFAWSDAQPLADRGGQGLLCVVQRQCQFGQAKHHPPVARIRRCANHTRRRNRLQARFSRASVPCESGHIAGCTPPRSRRERRDSRIAFPVRA